MTLLRTLLMLGVLLCTVVAPRVASADEATNCYANVTDANFGVVDRFGNTDVTATVTYWCKSDLFGGWLVASKYAMAKICIELGGGSAAGSTEFNRLMTNAQGDTLQFGLFSDPSRTQRWGHSRPNTPEVTVYYPLSRGEGESVPAQVTIYGRIPPQTGLAAGSYLNLFRAVVENDARIVYRYTDRRPQGDPTSCDAGGFNTQQKRSIGPFNVTAALPHSCAIKGATDMDFGLLTGAISGSLSQTSAITMECTRRTPWQIGLDNGQNASGDVRRLRSGSSYIAYELNRSAAGTRWGNTLGADTKTGTGQGTEEVVTVHGVINDQTIPAAGQYSDTIKATVTY